MKALKKLLAAALVAALPFAGLAQTPSAEPAKPAEVKPPTPLFTIYGTLNVNLQYTEAGDATAGSAADVSGRFAVSSDSTNIGIRGGLAVAHGLSVVYQCETAAALDSSAGSLCGRNSRVGLSGNWGTLFYGNWDTPLKAGTYGTKADDPFGNTDVFGFQGIMGSPGFNARSAAWSGSGNVHSFDLRAANSVAYWSPKIQGVSFKVQYAANEGRSAVGTVDPALYGAAVNFDMAGLSVVAAAEYHEDAFGLRNINVGENAGTTAAKDLAWRLSAGYELPVGTAGTFTVMGMFEQLSYKQEDAAGVDDLEEFKRMAWLLGAKFRTGNHELRARYSQALEPDATLADGTEAPSDVMADFKAQQFALGYAYHLAKSTQVYVFYTQIMNDEAAQYTLTIGGSPAVAGATPVGADPMAAGAGIRYAF